LPPSRRRQKFTVRPQGAAVEAEREACAARLAALHSIRTASGHAPASDDAPLAPVLVRALDGLRRALGALASGDQDRETVQQVIPPQLLRRPPAPVPAADVATQRQVARFVLDLHAAGDECRAKLEAVRQLIEEPAVFEEAR